MEDNLKTSADWYELKRKENPGFVIYDPDGWNRKDYDFSFNKEKITKDEFQSRCFKSTCLNTTNLNQ